MQFFSVYDLLLNKVRENNRTPDEMYTFFRERKIKKSQIVELQQTAFIPAEENFRGRRRTSGQRWYKCKGKTPARSRP